MGNSPRPGVWVLERSIDNGKLYSPWQYFADTPGDCVRYFGAESLQSLTKDDSVICETKFSKVVPLEGGEIVVSLLNDRPNADNFSYSPVLQEWTKATNIRLRLLRTKTLLGHLMSVARQDPTVTRRYFYSIKDINIGGRCVCNGHADTCDITDLNDPYKLLCRCQHNTCGPQCEQCCSGYLQKKWSRAIVDFPFVCEPCNCFSHSDECYYDEDIDSQKLSLDIHGHHEGGGVCQNCRHNTEGINCNHCRAGFYRPYGKPLNASDVCYPCICDLSFSTGNCADGSGQCECRHEFLPPYCDQCNIGYYGYPACRPCDCNVNGTHGPVCEVGGGQCPCKDNYDGKNCDRCKEGYYGFPACLPCECNRIGSFSDSCDIESGQCFCTNNFGGRQCGHCAVGYYNYPSCDFCSCDPLGSTEDICNNNTGECLCRRGFGGPRCDQCASGYFGYPNCQECLCSEQGAISPVCDNSGRCRCLVNYAGMKCDKCSPGHYNFPECLPCECSSTGSIGISCNDDGLCTCQSNFDGDKCNACREGFYNYPLCEECNCNPAGVLATFIGCGSLTSGELCECKERVTGRICDKCQPLYWNLKASNPLGCEECNCFPPGTVGGVGLCDIVTGQCMCKPNVGSRACEHCKDGSYQLEEDDLFGCTDCGCDIGGSVNSVCDKQTGQCACRPRINGRSCNHPLQTHYFPTLFQHQFEIEDGRTPAGTQVRFGYDENVFPSFSWRGYAVFSDIQREVLLDIYVEKPSLYQVIFHYLNFGGENVFGTITFNPETFGDIQQSSDMVFESTTHPRFMIVSGKQGAVPAPFVLNPGRWIVSIRLEKPLFLDYMVLLPQSYYEATLLQEDAKLPCKFGEKEGLCRQFLYPSLPDDGNFVRGEAGFVADEDKRTKTQLYTEEKVIEELEVGPMAWLNEDQKSLHMDLRVSKPGRYVLLILYHTPEGSQTTTMMLETATTNQMDKGRAILYNCTYTFICRQVVTDREDKIAIFDFESNFVSVTLESEELSNIAIEGVAAIPYDMWDSDYLVPQSHCVRRDGICAESIYAPVPEATKVEFESGLNSDRVATKLPDTIQDTGVGLVYLDHSDSVIDVQGAVPEANYYTFVVHYYQPDHPKFDMDVLIQNGQFYEAVLPLHHCPGSGGCRAVVQSQETNTTSFQILQNFVLSLKEPNHKSVWLDYVLVVPTNHFNENLEPLLQDKAGKFITECGQNNFYISSGSEGFCREATYSLASEYNNGALPCTCDTDGSLSFECAEFGGQCHCKPNVIGRTCSQCKTGFFGFPDCKPCDCPSTAYCHPVTGQCICPPRVTGDRCDMCVAYTYGFDPIIGCEECNCNPLGVNYGKLQCDLQTGQCECKTNVVGRTCEKCKAGYWAFPYCQLCNCDLRGASEDICDQDSAQCYCKENVYGEFCDQCKPGTFYLEESNPLGCTKCFCFGTTDRCTSSYHFKIQVLEMEEWKGVGAKLDTDLEEVELNAEVESVGDTVRAVLQSDLPTGTLFYFSAPEEYLGKKVTSYGGTLSYTLYTAVDYDSTVGSIVGPDVILMGNNITIVHDHLEQPAGGLPLDVSVSILEREFHHLSGREVSREQLMMVLVNLKAIFIRGSYFYPSLEIRLTHVLLDIASDELIADAPQALRVEQCQCPPNYKGTSCEECSPGYFRAKTGPYLGFCVPCQCNGHAYSCNVNTGKCIDCRHNTVGDHCEMCAPGYHGVATQGTPYDCLICACPLPIESNNFAVSCEVSPSGLEISCNCKPGYYGPRCEVCAAGYFGYPEVPGNSCQECMCSGNIDPANPASCDSYTGECTLCLNNTYGNACELCAPGFYGDAINRKNCQQCRCDRCGTHQCSHTTGECQCWPNVIGYECDQCAPNHWGFESCSGCRPCNCGPASESEQCDLQTGQCHCKPGAAGYACDICEPGFWLYSSEGCISCQCAEKYSAGAVCNPVSGQCQCLPGVIGDKCDSCPYRWVFLNKQGCQECGPCVHALLDDTDAMRELIDPVQEELKDASISYFAYRRLDNVNRTASLLWPQVEELIFDPNAVDLTPLQYDVQSLERDADNSLSSAEKTLTQSEEVSNNADATRQEALDVDKLIVETVQNTLDTVRELEKLAEGLTGNLGPNLDRLIAEGERMLEDIMSREFGLFRNDSLEELQLASELIEQVKLFTQPSSFNAELLGDQLKQVDNLHQLLNELRNYSHYAIGVAQEANGFNSASKSNKVQDFIKHVDQISEQVKDALKDAEDLLKKAREFLYSGKEIFSKLEVESENLQQSIDGLKDYLKELEEELEEIHPLIEETRRHANTLMEQAALLDSFLADTRESADGAVKAASAYNTIVDAISDALTAAQDAVRAANEASGMSDGVADRADASRTRSDALLEEARQLLDNVAELGPRLENAKEEVLLVAYQNGGTSRGLDHINKEMDKLPHGPLGILASLAANNSAAADAEARKALDKIQDIVNKLPEDVEKSKEVKSNFEESEQAIRGVYNYVDRVSSIVPEVSNLINNLGQKDQALRITGKDVGNKVAELQRKVALARDQANRIKLGLTFFPNTTLQLRNPEGLQRAATYSQLSLYFRTRENYGLLTYIGNELGTYTKLKRVQTDDFMALEIREGNIVLTMDLGSGTREIRHPSYVSDGQWHQAIIERTGKTCTITVRTEGEPDEVKEDHLPGTNTVFNLDQQLSKFYVGGIPDTANIQNDVKNYRFDGCIEELTFGKTPVGLWDFVEAANNFEGCVERDQLVILEPTNGLRFDGSGYAVLPKNRQDFTDSIFVSMQFKTYASEGLLFLIGKNDNLLALELSDGKAVFKYDLGSGLAEIISENTYNDGNWHVLEASRSEKEGILKVDNVEVGTGTSESPGDSSQLSTTEYMYVGGYPGSHHYSDVTNVDFEGCIRDLQIETELKDLNKNVEALGVVAGCPTTIARTVSFSELPGYVGMPTSNLEHYAQLTFKFNTAEPDGLIFYAANEDQSNYITVSLSGGSLILKSQPGGEIRTGINTKYNDKEWHYVTATKVVRQMRLDIDDIDSVEVELDREALTYITSPLYFGGVPSDYEITEDANVDTKYFLGCIGDVTVNGRFQNFASTQDRKWASLASCPVGEQAPAPGVQINSTLHIPKGEREEERERMTTDVSVIRTTPEPTPPGRCLLPMQPAVDPDIDPENGMRFGNSLHSRQEFAISRQFISSLLDESHFSVEFRVNQQDGIMFYVAGKRHIDFVGIYMQEGKVYYVFNCGTGSAVITTENTYNDGEWHKASFSRRGQNGTLIIDDAETVHGSSQGSTSSMNVRSPVYVGGLPETFSRDAKNNLKGIIVPFPGCIRNVRAKDRFLKEPSLTVDVSACSDKVEEGTFFGVGGGYLILYDNYIVGKMVSITLDIKPRNLSGVLMAVHHKNAGKNEFKDYLVLQMVDGRVIFTVDNGAGNITTIYEPPENNYLCNGKWHTIQAIKNGNVVTLSVDGIFVTPGIGAGGVLSTNTNDPLYIGGIPDPGNTKGIDTVDHYIGCIRYLELNSRPQSLAQSRVHGKITLNSCPTI